MTNPGYDASTDRALYRDADDTITPDANGHEWLVEPQYTRRPIVSSPLMADVPGADPSHWSSEARPPVTAYEGADMDAYWLDNGTWRHCRTGKAWAGESVNLLDSVDQFRASQNAIIDHISTALFASLDSVREGSDYQMEAAQ